MVNEFRLGEFLDNHGELMAFTLMIEGEKARRGAGSYLDQNRFDFLLEVLQQTKKFCDSVNFLDGSEKIGRTLRDYKSPTSIDVSALGNELMNVCQSVIACARKHRFLRVAGDRVSYVDNSDLFGARVSDSFPSATRDITEAGNCLAAECNTAAVFHLMRLAEYGLRALARDRQISLPKNADLDLATWEEILRRLEGAELAIQGYPKTSAREQQYEFYHGAMMEFKRFKNVFRNPIMHTRDGYDRDQAHSAFAHVRDFMKILATKISETISTPMIWV